MTEEIKTTDNNQKMSVYCKTCICKSCEQASRLEQENKQMKSALEEIRILATKNVSIENFVKIQNKINEVLNHSES